MVPRQMQPALVVIVAGIVFLISFAVLGFILRSLRGRLHDDRVFIRIEQAWSTIFLVAFAFASGAVSVNNLTRRHGHFDEVVVWNSPAWLFLFTFFAAGLSLWSRGACMTEYFWRLFFVSAVQPAVCVGLIAGSAISLFLWGGGLTEAAILMVWVAVVIVLQIPFLLGAHRFLLRTFEANGLSILNQEASASFKRSGRRLLLAGALCCICLWIWWVLSEQCPLAGRWKARHSEVMEITTDGMLHNFTVNDSQYSSKSTGYPCRIVVSGNMVEVFGNETSGLSGALQRLLNRFRGINREVLFRGELADKTEGTFTLRAADGAQTAYERVSEHDAAR